MALRDQPYFPFYVDDYLSDEKVKQCDPSSEGIYIRMLASMHKSKVYGTIEITPFDESKLKQTASKIEANSEQKILLDHLGVDHVLFALFVVKVANITGRTNNHVFSALIDLLGNGVLQVEGKFIQQKRMVIDGRKSEIRAEAGRQKGKQRESKTEAKPQQNPVNGDVYVYEDYLEKGVQGEKPFVKPTYSEVEEYCKSRNNGITASEFMDFYESKGWFVGKNKMKDWRAAIRTWEIKRKAECPKPRNRHGMCE